MNTFAALVAGLCLLAPPAAPDPGRGESLDPILTPYLARHGLPALGAAVVKGGEVVASGVVGVRRAGTAIPATLDDRFHIGSDTKAMTALLAAMLVDEGKLRLDATVGELFPDLSATMDPGVRAVTLEQLLSHTSGLPGDRDDPDFIKLLEAATLQDGNLDAMRRWLVEQYVRRPLAAKPGERFAYANMNYVLAGAAIERATGATWEEVITNRLFDPLGLKTAGLGPQAAMGRVDAPLGHKEVGGTLTAFLAGPNGDGPAVVGPAGIAHMSVLDFARWAGWNAGGGRRGPALVRPETFDAFHRMVVTIAPRPGAAPGTPGQGRYGLGWGERTVPWAPHPLRHHAGSNTMNLAYAWVDPPRDLAIVIVTNLGGDRAQAALESLSKELYERFVE